MNVKDFDRINGQFGFDEGNHEPEKHSVQIKIHPSYTDKKTGEEIVLLPSEQLGLPDRYTKPWGNCLNIEFWCIERIIAPYGELRQD